MNSIHHLLLLVLFHHHRAALMETARTVNVCTTPINTIGLRVSIDECPVLFRRNRKRIKGKCKRSSPKCVLPILCCPPKWLELKAPPSRKPRPKSNKRFKTRKPKVLDFPKHVRPTVQEPLHNKTKNVEHDQQPSTTEKTIVPLVQPLSTSFQHKVQIDDIVECGKAGSLNRVIHGIEAAIDQFPWLGALEYATGFKFRCAGSLVSRRHVITAAHCVHPGVLPVNVRLGDHNIYNDNEGKYKNGTDCQPVGPNQSDCNYGPNLVPIETIVRHPDFNNVTFENDMAIIKLSRNVTFTDFIKPVCLPDEDATVGQPVPKLHLSVAGWGLKEDGRMSAVKMYATAPLKPMSECRRAYPGFPLSERRQVCFGDAKGDSCNGDSGGPLMRERDVERGYELTGVVSYGVKECGRSPGVYAKVYHYLDWIASTIRSMH